MSIINVNHKKVQLFSTSRNSAGDGSACTTTQSMVIVDGHAYILKCNNAKNASVNGNRAAILYVIRNIASETPTHSNPIQIYYGENTYKLFQHPNGLTHHDATFFIANYKKLDNQSDIIGFNSSGQVTKKLNLDSSLPASSFAGNSISSITYYKNNKYIIGTQKTNSNRKYWVVHFDYTTNRIINDYSFIAEGCNVDGWEGNDIYYNSSEDMFYVTLTYKNNNKIAINNRIYSYSLQNLVANASIPVSRILEDDLDTSKGESRYEIEGMSIYNGKKYVAVERLISNPPSGYESDGVFSLYTL